jgi:sulfite reductase (ferredoxin)
MISPHVQELILNLGIASSTGIAEELERVLKLEFPQYKENREITIKISGCMMRTTCQQLVFRMSIKAGKLVASTQVLLGGEI